MPIETTMLIKIVLIFSLPLTLEHGNDTDDSLSICCSGSITLGATGAAAAKWAQYLGQYKPTQQKHQGALVYQNQKGKYLYHYTKGQWRTNNVINDRGVFKGINSRKDICLSPNSKWYFWNEEWTKGDIKVSCEQDSEGKEHGMCRNLSFNISNSSFS